MHMHMSNGLACHRPVVLQDVVRRYAKPPDKPICQDGDEPEDPGGQVGGHFVHMFVMGPGDQQQVPAGERLNIQKGQGEVVYVDAVAGDLACDDPAEDAVWVEGPIRSGEAHGV